MKIEYKDNKQVRLSEIERGKCFEYDNELYIKAEITKIDDWGNSVVSCVDLENGYVCWFAEDDVTPVNAKVVVEE